MTAETARIVVVMVRLAEGLGFALPWANLLDALSGVSSPTEVRRATDDLIDQGVLETSTHGLRFALAAPSLPPGEVG